MHYDLVPSSVSGPPPKVSVVMVTYKHETYIAQAIDSVLMQRTNFPIELLIGEDCSPDGTRQIVLDFQHRHPDRIRLLLWRKNTGAANNFHRTLEACRGEYVAFCEGDDYWTDPDKLQRQVDMLDGHPELAMCHHPVDYVRWENGARKVLFSHPQEADRGTRHAKDLISHNFIQTCSLLMRRSCLPVLDARYLALRVGDWPLTYLAAEHGDIGYLDPCMADYRVHDSNSWYQLDTSVHYFESARVCMYLASVAQPSAQAPWRSAGLSMLTMLMRRQSTFGDATRTALSCWRSQCLTFPQSLDLLARRLETLGKNMKAINVLRKLMRSINKRLQRLALSLDKKRQRLSKSLNKKKRKLADLYLLEQRKELALKSLDRSKETILVVSHEASRTGAPILALNIAQQLNKKYNVISMVLGGGALLPDFEKHSAYVIHTFQDLQHSNYGWTLLDKLLPLVDFRFAIVNSIVSIPVLPILKAHRIPSLCLVHEFASYTPPRDAICEVERLAGKVVFSAEVVYENNAAECPALREKSRSVILPQGKCEIPPTREEDQDLSGEPQIRQMLRPESCPANTVVILGAGTVSIRKGVDFFMMCAARVVELKPRTPFRFVWVGSGFKPEEDFAYSVYVQDQLERAGLADHVCFAGEAADIELVYELSDVLLLSSRLDPLPNVAIDSMLKQLPVVCFDRTTGIADILKQNGLGDACVAPYLDVERAAQLLVALIDDSDLRTQLGLATQKVGERLFNMESYVAALERHALECVTEQQTGKSGGGDHQ